MKMSIIYLSLCAILTGWMTYADLTGQVVGFALGFGGKRYQTFNHK